MIFAGLSKRQDWPSILEELYRHEKIQIFDVHCRFLVRFNCPTRRDDFCRFFWILVQFPVLLDSNLCSSACALTHGNPRQNSLSPGLNADGEGKHQSNEGEKSVSLFCSRFPSIFCTCFAKSHASLRGVFCVSSP